MTSPDASAPLAGDPAHWDRIWGEMHEDAVLYTPRRPTSLSQFCHRAYFEDLWALMGTRAHGARYLELGCGRGTTSMYLAARGQDVTMLDLAPQALKLAQANFRQVGIKAPRMVLADARQTNLPGASFDCVCNIGLLEHFEDPRPVIAEALRLLSPGGLAFMVIVPKVPASREWLTNLLFCPWHLTPRWLRRLGGRLIGLKMDPSPEATLRTEHSVDQYAQWAREAGASDVACIPYNPYHVPYHVARLRRLMEKPVVVPLYLFYYALKRAMTRPPHLRTWGCTASCELLTFRAGRASR
jgi:ubiquinone/menaquinone biosynthesis C-methylase UbiE